MDFLNSKESLTTLQWALRAIVAFFFLFFMAKLMGKRFISQLGFLDFIMALLLGNILAHPLSDEHLGMKGSMITMTVLVILYSIGVFLSLKWYKFRNLLDSSPSPIIKNGQIIYKNLVKARIPIDFLLLELRKEKIEDIQKVSLALWEPDGTVSFFLNPQYQALSPKDMQLATKPFVFPKVIIRERKIDFNELNQIGKDEMWLKNTVNIKYNTDINNILLATIDNNNNMKICLYK